MNIRNFSRVMLGGAGAVMTLRIPETEGKEERIAERWTGIGWREIEFQRLVKNDRFRLLCPPENDLWKWKGCVSWICSEKPVWNEELQRWAVKVKDKWEK